MIHTGLSTYTTNKAQTNSKGVVPATITRVYAKQQRDFKQR